MPFYCKRYEYEWIRLTIFILRAWLWSSLEDKALVPVAQRRLNTGFCHHRTSSRRSQSYTSKAFLFLPVLILDLVDQRADLLDPNPDITTILQHDSGLAEEANTGGCAGEEDGAGFQRCALGEVGNLFFDVEDHVSVFGKGEDKVSLHSMRRKAERDGMSTYLVFPSCTVSPL